MCVCVCVWMHACIGLLQPPCSACKGGINFIGLLFGMVFMYSWNAKARLRRESVEKILVGHREESVLEDILELCH